jgi:hypothetical protein
MAASTPETPRKKSAAPLTPDVGPVTPQGQAPASTARPVRDDDPVPDPVRLDTGVTGAGPAVAAGAVAPTPVVVDRPTAPDQTVELQRENERLTAENERLNADLADLRAQYNQVNMAYAATQEVTIAEPREVTPTNPNVREHVVQDAPVEATGVRAPGVSTNIMG